MQIWLECRSFSLKDQIIIEIQSLNKKTTSIHKIFLLKADLGSYVQMEGVALVMLSML